MTVTLAATLPKSGTPKTFRSYSELLRFLAAECPQAGRPRNAADLYLGSLRLDGTAEAYPINRMLWRWRMTDAQATTLVTLQLRYRRYRHYLTEVLPEWQDGPKAYYMDNSVEVTQTDKWGNVRRVMVIAPHGDAC